MEGLTDKQANDLRFRIVEQACNDYIFYKRKLLERKFTINDNEEKCRNEISKLTTFFKSHWYSRLCNIPYESLIKRLDERAANPIQTHKSEGLKRHSMKRKMTNEK